MTSRLARLWQPGNPQKRVFLPDFWMAVVEKDTVGRNRLPKNCVKFEVDPRMSKHDIREYLSKIYNLPVRDVRTEVQMGDIMWNNKTDYQYKKALWKEADQKFAYVFLSKGFEFEYPRMFDVDEEETQLAKVKDQQEKADQNVAFVNRDRNGVGSFFGV